MDIREWLARVTDEASVNSIAKESSLSQTSLNGQIAKGAIPAESVVAIARRYPKAGGPIAALVELGLITEEEARDVTGLVRLGVRQALVEATADEIVEEVGRRLRERGTGSGAADGGPDGDGPDDELGARRDQPKGPRGGKRPMYDMSGSDIAADRQNLEKPKLGDD